MSLFEEELALEDAKERVFNKAAALRKERDEMFAVLVYARDMLDHLAKFDGHDMTLLREVIVKVLGDPTPEVGSTFSDVLAIARGIR